MFNLVLCFPALFNVPSFSCWILVGRIEARGAGMGLGWAWILSPGGELPIFAASTPMVLSPSHRFKANSVSRVKEINLVRAYSVLGATAVDLPVYRLFSGGAPISRSTVCDSYPPVCRTVPCSIVLAEENQYLFPLGEGFLPDALQSLPPRDPSSRRINYRTWTSWVRGR